MKAKNTGMDCACGALAEYKTNLRFNGVTLDGWKCHKCGEEYHNPEIVERILLLNKLKKHKYCLKLSQVRSNLILRIPKEVGEVLNLKKGEEMGFRLKNDNTIEISPA
ncbi:AbrB/MazE/SpoVT family DNA-binding domain-containing protein [Candidatus Micrarchaeota archaeon]|nr:AbrB/MazE/SpoVT family DNA-binding domain-containing protein [Candidatus Micrarchaeota archaeon]